MELNKDQSLEAYRMMMLIRRFEEKCAELYAAGDIGGFLHLYIGQESLAIAAQYALREDDNLITAYRDHGLALARGLPVKNVMAEMMGKDTGTSRGKGGSMHLADKERRFWGGWAIVGGHLPIAAGLALADQYSGDDRVTMAFMGDGSTNIGYFHEALNLSGVWDLPVVWVVENNQYGMGTAVERASGQTDISQKGAAYGMPTGITVEGQNLLELIAAFQEGIEYARSGKGPYFMEVMTYRFRGHSMGDPERYRPVEEVNEKKETTDPITLWGRHLINEGLATEDDLQGMADEADETVEEAVKFGHESPNPAPEALYENIYV